MKGRPPQRNHLPLKPLDSIGQYLLSLLIFPHRVGFYPEGHPLHGVSSIEIRYMTAKEEDILTSQALIKKGVAIERLLQNVIVDKSFSVNDLLIGDKNALLVATRVTGYGAEYTTNVTCPSCNNTDEHTFDLQDGKMNDVEEAVASFNGTLTEQNTFLITLPMTDATVECRLLTGGDELRLQKESERKARRNIEESSLTDQFPSIYYFCKRGHLSAHHCFFYSSYAS